MKHSHTAVLNQNPKGVCYGISNLLRNKIIEHTETCVKSAQGKPNHSCAWNPLFYKIRLIKWINQDTTGSFPTWHWLVNMHDLAVARATKKPSHKEDSWKTWTKVSGSLEDLHWSLFRLCLPWMTSVGAALAFGQCLCLMAWIAEHMSIVSAT